MGIHYTDWPSGPQVEIALPKDAAAIVGTNSHLRDFLRGVGSQLEERGIVSSFRVGSRGEVSKPEAHRDTVVVCGNIGQSWDGLRNRVNGLYPQLEDFVSPQADWMRFYRSPDHDNLDQTVPKGFR